MISDAELRTLAEFVSDMPPVVSLFLNVDPVQKSKEEWRITLRNLLRQVSGVGSSRDLASIEHYFELEYDGGARGVILFACQDQGLWQVLRLPVPVADRIVAARRPYIAALQDLLDRYSRYSVVLVEREGARLFLFQMGELREVSGFLGDQLKRHRQGGWAAKRLQRRADSAAQQNFKDVARVAESFCNDNACDRLIIGGSADNTSAFRALLPKSMRERVVGEITMDTWASEVDVRDRTMDLISSYTRQADAQLVGRIVTAASKGASARMGLSDTLKVLHEDRVHMLAVAEGYESAGACCDHCRYLSAEAVGPCPYCGGHLTANEQVVNAAVQRAIGNGIAVKIVAGNEELVQAGGIGALLRY
jgi:peptide chain release factor subunit 1